MNSERRGAAVQSAHVFHGGFDLRCDEIRYDARGCCTVEGEWGLIHSYPYTCTKRASYTTARALPVSSRRASQDGCAPPLSPSQWSIRTLYPPPHTPKV